MYKNGELFTVHSHFSSAQKTNSELFTWDRVSSWCSQCIKKDNEMFAYDVNTQS